MQVIIFFVEPKIDFFVSMKRVDILSTKLEGIRRKSENKRTGKTLGNQKANKKGNRKAIISLS